MNNLPPMTPSATTAPNELPAAKTEPTQTKKPYNKPILYICGDFRDITLGGSPGSGESEGGQFSIPFSGGTRHYER